MQPIEDVVEDFVQRNTAFVPSFGNTQGWTDVRFELLLRYTNRDSAHGGLPLVGFFLHDALSISFVKSLNQFIDIVSGFHREMSKHFYRAKTKLSALSQINQDVPTNKISRNIQYCELLVRNILLTATGAESTHQKIHLYEAMLDTIALIERKALPARIELIIDVVPRDLTIETDKLGLQQVLMNLGRNAIDAIKHDGCILFNSHMAVDRVHIDIIDTGPGIPEELQDRIFQLGFSTKSGGYGIGLHSVKSIVEELKGKIDFQTSIGFGTIMHLELPLGEIND